MLPSMPEQCRIVEQHQLEQGPSGSFTRNSIIATPGTSAVGPFHRSGAISWMLSTLHANPLILLAVSIRETARPFTSLERHPLGV